MRYGNIEDSLFCFGMAVAKDLPDIEYERKLPKKGVAYNDLPTEKAVRRPFKDDLYVHSFPQTWGSTALGHGGVGGASMTTAQTTVVTDGQRRSAAVYFGTMLAYVIVKPNQRFFEDIRAENIAATGEHGKYTDAT